jgi:hypothetical protein
MAQHTPKQSHCLRENIYRFSLATMGHQPLAHMLMCVSIPPRPMGLMAFIMGMRLGSMLVAFMAV